MAPLCADSRFHSTGLKCVVLLLAAPLLVFAASGCRSSRNANEILVGQYGSLTGDQATFGQSTDSGIRLAVDEINAAGGVNGKKIHLITYDDKGDPREAATSVTRLITNDGVVAVLGEVASKLSLEGAPICQKYGVPMITPSSTNPKVTEVGDMIFRVCFIDPFQGFVCAKFARDNLKAETAAILYDQSQTYSVGLQDEFEKSFLKLGGKITTKQAYQKGEQDFNAQLTAIRASKPDVVFIPGYYNDVGTIAVQARKLGITVPLLGGDGWESPKLAEIAGDAINGCYYSNHYSPQDPSPRVQNFIKKYKEQYHATPDSMAALAYDATYVLKDAIGRANSLSGAAIAEQIAKTKDFDGVTGKITIDDHRNAVKPAVILEMKNGEATYVTTIKPESREQGAGGRE
jgi:branched-chain amino acid transport system substrate-binding protein